MKSFPVYGEEEVRALLDYDGCIASVRDAMARFTADDTLQPLRTIFTLAPDKIFGVMPGALSEPGAFGAKLITVFGDAEQPGRTAHRGLVVIFDRIHGDVIALADAHEVTKIRTGAASAVATDVLARKDARRMAVFGCGAEAESHVRAISRVRDLEEVIVWGRSLDRATAFAAWMATETGLSIRALPDAREAAANADIICTVTASVTPVLLGEWVRPGAHVNAVGSGRAGPVEVDSSLVLASRYIVDSRRAALAAASEFLVARAAGLCDESHIAAEIGEVLLGRVPGRTADHEITFYKSLGHVVQDLSALDYLHRRATGAPLGGTLSV